MWTRTLAFLTWAAVAASGVFWGLRLLAVPAALPTGVVAAAQSAPPTADLQRLLGAGARTDAQSDDGGPTSIPEGGAPQGLVLSGVIAPPVTRPVTPPSAPQRTARGGIALISVAGQPARPFRVGDRLQGDWVLLEVQARAALVGPAGGPAAFALMLPEKSANARNSTEPPAPMLLPATPTPQPAPGTQAGADTAASGDAGALPPTESSVDAPAAEGQNPAAAADTPARPGPPPGRMTVPETEALKRMGPLTR
jgi:general secretion pathway protein C